MAYWLVCSRWWDLCLNKRIVCACIYVVTSNQLRFLRNVDEQQSNKSVDIFQVSIFCRAYSQATPCLLCTASEKVTFFRFAIYEFALMQGCANICASLTQVRQLIFLLLHKKHTSYQSRENVFIV